MNLPTAMEKVTETPRRHGEERTHHEVHEGHEGSDKEFSHHGGTEKRGLTTKVTKSTKVRMGSFLTTEA